MSRRRSTPWIHRWSRLIIAAIAAIGAFGTGYLTITKFLGATAACPTSGCERVLTSPYATVFGLPLTLFGFLAYASMGVLALAPLAINPETDKQRRADLENISWLLIFAIAIAMAVFSGYLMYLLAFKIQALCIYCLFSALFSFSFVVLALIGRSWQDIGQLFFTGIVVGMLVLVGTLGVYANVDRPVTADNSNIPGEAGPPITSTSSSAQLALAEHLSKVGAKMYGAFWCPHCHDQKELFGKEAFKQITYVECDPQGQNPQPDVCQAAKIQGYPTWEIDGKFYSGTQTLEQLADLSGYQGPRTFQSP